MSDLSNPVEAVVASSQQSDDAEAVVDSSSVDYIELVRFLMEPFLEAPTSLRASCEMSHQNQRVLVRLAIEGEDKGKIFGRGGRNVQAVRTILQAVGQSAHQRVHLEVFGGDSEWKGSESSEAKKSKPTRTSPRRPTRRSDRPSLNNPSS